MAVLVTGAAGYIGSHMVARLLQENQEVVGVDDLSKGHREAVLTQHFYQGDIEDESLMSNIIQKHGVDRVVHFAAHSLVGESMKKPLMYYENNVCKTAKLLKVLQQHQVKKVVFSSTAAVYGQPDMTPITEDMPTKPQNPYGETKLAVEKMLGWAKKAYGIHSVCLRYFNACGAHKEGIIGEDHRPETHLIPNVVKAAMGMNTSVKVFGDDYPTPDGTCIRDYIYIEDLIQAHLLALEKLEQQQKSHIYNLGSEKGYSVMEIIRGVEQVTEKKLNIEITKRRLGDPAILIASGQKAKKQMGFQPKTKDIHDIIETVVAFYQKHPKGYGGSHV